MFSHPTCNLGNIVYRNIKSLKDVRSEDINALFAYKIVALVGLICILSSFQSFRRTITEKLPFHRFYIGSLDPLKNHR